MTRTVHCILLKADLPGLDAPPFPGPRGQEIYKSVSAQAWEAWQHQQTMLINEKNLNLIDRDARKYLGVQRDRYLAGEPTDHAEGYVAPE
jgi:Fe-S cluster biosynthesis and repair protein YggX